MTRITMTMLVVLSVLLPPPAHSQEREATPPEVPELNMTGMIAGGAVGSVGGGLLGAVVGVGIEAIVSPCRGCEYEGWTGAYLGVVIGSVVMAPVLAHRWGGGDGNVKTGILMTALGTVGGVALAAAWNDGGFLVPLSQVFAAVMTERHTSRRRR